MFRKIVSNLAFSPAVIGQFSFYAKRLRKEEATRRLGIIFTVMALTVQSFSVFAAPEAANAASPTDFIRGGAYTKDVLLANYDRNTNNIKDIFTSLGITRDEIASTQEQTINSKDALYSFGMVEHWSEAQGGGTYSYQRSDGGTGQVYYGPLRNWDTLPYTKANGSSYPSFVGYSAKFGWFALLKRCGNLVSKKIPNPPAPVPSPAPVPQPYAECSKLSIIKKGRTIIQPIGQAATQNGAAINAYIFTIKGEQGTILNTQQVTTSANDAIPNSVKLSNAGNYTASVVVRTSLGDKTGSQCQAKFSVSPPAVCAFNNSLPANSPDCQPCEGDSNLWIKDQKCAASIIENKTAQNLTHDSVDATTITAMASDKISYKVSVTNKGLAQVNAPIKENLRDVLEYASIIDAGGGTFDSESNTLSWPSVQLKPDEVQSRVFIVQLASSVPAVGVGTSDSTSFDCTMSNTFGNNVAISVDCPPTKQVENVITQLPKTGAGANLLFIGLLLATVVYFYSRARQLKTEVRLIRRDINAGTL